MKVLSKRRWLAVALVATAAAACGLYLAFGRAAGDEAEYQLAQVTRGDLESTVSATGTLSAVGTVEVGTQVSGTIEAVFVDFNDTVRKGQILAVLDTTLLQASVMDADAALMSAEAQYEQATEEYGRGQRLFDGGLLSEQEFLPLKVAVRTREAGLKSAKAARDRAALNLKNAVIRSPIDGTVISRSIDPGQTVAASFSSPTLFVVAESLTDMEIHALVDENDIGQIKQGQAARFTVQAYPDETFEGVVRQIQLQPSTVQNVVNYTVVIDASNRKGLLLPGMTATVDFVIDQRTDVLLVPNAAVKIAPTAAMIAEVRGPAPGPRGPAAGGKVQAAGASDANAASDLKMLWYLDSAGRLKVQPVKVGMTDGHLTEVVSGEDVHEGMQVVSALAQSAQPATNSRSDAGPPPMRLF
jgi:HlyD family secretion protein